MSTYMRDYAHMSDDDMARIRAAMSDAAHRDIDEPTPQGRRPSPMLVGVAATTASVMTLLAGAFYLGWLVYGQPDTGNPAIDDSASYWGEIMSHSAYGVIGIFGGVLGLVGVAACTWISWLTRRWHEQRAEAERIAARERRQIIEAERIAAGDVHKLADSMVDLASLVGDLGADLEKIKGALEKLAGWEQDGVKAAVEMLTARLDAVSDQLVDALGARNGLRIVKPQTEQN